MNHLTTEEILELVDSHATSHSNPMAVEHFHQCSECLEKFRSFQRLQTDLRSMEIPEVSSGFAIRVIAKIREKETMRIFSRPAFKIFRWTLAFSVVIIAGALIFYTTGNSVTIPQLRIPAGGYYLTFAICLALVLAFDKSLSRLQK
jgi:hypothetical protein